MTNESNHLIPVPKPEDKQAIIEQLRNDLLVVNGEMQSCHDSWSAVTKELENTREELASAQKKIRQLLHELGAMTHINRQLMDKQ